jgi:hypothetical protein
MGTVKGSWETDVGLCGVLLFMFLIVSPGGLFDVWLSAHDALVFIAILRAGILMEFTEELWGFTLCANLHEASVSTNLQNFLEKFAA